MMSKTKTTMMSVFALFAILFAVSLVSAVPDCPSTLCFQNVDAPTTVSHGDTIQITFDVEYESTTDGGVTTLEFDDPAQVSTSSQGDLTMPTNVQITDDIPRSFTAILEVPDNANGVINVVLRVATLSGSTAQFTVPVIAIENDPEFTLTESTEFTTSSDGVIRVENTGNVDFTGIELVSSGEFTVDFSVNDFNLAAGDSIDVTVSSMDIGNVGFEGKSTTITATASDGTSKQLTLGIEGSFCRAGPQGGKLEIKNIDINNNGEGDDEEWFLLDEVEIEVEVENTADVDVDDVFIELGLFDSEGNNMIDEMDFDNADEEEFDVGNLNDGDEETVTFVFTVPADFEDDGNYRLTVKAYSDDEGESNECTDSSSDLSDDTFESISIEREDDEGRFIAFDNIVFTPSEATCGERVTLSTDLYNIGDDDLEDRIRVLLRNSDLGLDEEVVITNDMDQGDRESVSFEFTVPQDLEDGNYQLRLSSQYDYRNGVYRESSDEDTLAPLRVLGCDFQQPPTTGGNFAVISAVLDSDAVAGEELVVRATITNIAGNSRSFVVDASGYNSWATRDSISQQVLQLDNGESSDVVMRFTVDDDASGQEEFTISVQSAGQTQSREVVVNIAGGDNGGVSSPGFEFGDNTYLWIIGIVNVILIILIIIVAVRISRR